MCTILNIWFVKVKHISQHWSFLNVTEDTCARWRLWASAEIQAETLLRLNYNWDTKVDAWTSAALKPAPDTLSKGALMFQVLDFVLHLEWTRQKQSNYNYKGSVSRRHGPH